MPAKVTLTVTEGKLCGKAFVFEERATCVIGRAEDCEPRLPDDEAHRGISRHHCLLDINPPDICVRDFGSLNGTFVNGQNIGQRRPEMTPEEGARLSFPEHDLFAGDQLRLEGTVFEIGVTCPPCCVVCGTEMPSDAGAPDADGSYRCAKHDIQPTRFNEPAAAVAGRRCAHCGKDVGAEANPNRPGEFICAVCKADPARLLDDLLGRASAGESELLAIRGYQIERELGRGGMGATYLARHEATGEQVALKVMLPRVAASAHARELFLREVANTQALDHPHVVRLRDAGCSDGTFFFTMDYCEGGSLDRWMRARGGRLRLVEAAGIILQVLDGLDYAHNAEVPYVQRGVGVVGRGRGLVHRDLSPHNILLSAVGAKVSDYGLAKAFDAAGLSGQTNTGAFAGKPAFVPRQQLVNYKYARPEVDVWAAAACLYCMLTGLPPRDFPEGRDPWRAVLESDAVPIRRREPGLPPPLAEVIDYALVDRPKIGFPSAAQFKRALQTVL